MARRKKSMSVYSVHYRVGKRTNKVRVVRVRAITSGAAQRKLKSRIKGKVFIRKVNKVSR